MKLFLTSLLLLPLTAPALAESAPSAEAKLAIELKDRTAGEPVDCITQSNIRSAEIYDHTAILYEMRDGTRYVNRPASGLNLLDGFAVMVTDTHTPRLCSIDVVRLVDPGLHSPRGFVQLGKFVPWRKQAG
ncbi:MAG: hypothetical protein P0Y56_08965 [Candidatus Andeanibacterium colombiense]|uniref:Uncharacterized protein n=1 Tax=Candidatus Andeanibacterium colombiense TaxID=3121345 RepID=A0AAJ5X5X4_9SPHN|nr:MAG: hypothetical protein P0Y56_08965 [Sphingomonadaceae bacterium]